MYILLKKKWSLIIYDFKHGGDVFYMGERKAILKKFNTVQLKIIPQGKALKKLG